MKRGMAKNTGTVFRACKPFLCSQKANDLQAGAVNFEGRGRIRRETTWGGMFERSCLKKKISK